MGFSSYGDTSGSGRNYVQRGTDQFFNSSAFADTGPGKAVVVPADGENVQLSLVNATISGAAKAVLGEALKLNYVVADGLEGRVTLQTTAPVPKDTLLELFNAALAANRAQIVQDGNVVKVVAGTDGNTTFRLAGADGASSSAIMVAPLNFVSASEMVKILQPLIDQGLKVDVQRQRNLLLLSGDGGQMQSALDALNLFDVDVLQGKSVALVPLHSADPDAIVTELKRLFSAEEGGMLDGVIDFVPNPRLQSILVITSRQAYLDRAEKWIRDLDKGASGSQVYMAVYELQNRSATEVAPIIDQLLGGENSNASGSSSADTGAEAASEGGNSSSGSAGQQFDVAADDSRNALLVRADKDTQDQIAALLTTLDAPARQVLLEATIAEVTLNDQMQLGTRWFFESGNWSTGFSDLSSGGVAGSAPGFSAIFGVGKAELALSALASVTNVKVISSPTLMVLDNKEGTLQIGDQVPIATQTASGRDAANATVLTQVSYRDTGVILHVRPRIGAGGRVLLDIEQEVSSVQANKSSGIDSPTIRQRKIGTSVALADGSTLILGGLVQEDASDSRTQTPGLGDVPILGNLFRRKDGVKSRSELLILIRPHVVDSNTSAQSITSSWRGRMAASNSLVTGGIGLPRHSLQDFGN
ncbi:type II secretion system secretin GspD [Stagnihabitans tardus]|uniref:Type II secretion system secretin GspD n=1 Tax=Stagnihabitans tardus TaxID=2699202 RepID=A0AAE4YH69_9RHOB|nr:type II secretion system secretin GspD [Stagnihabitans tardus]NBZ90074.1 type II secretion system secretin GspD [Stagnihabitans tardus]